MTRSETIMQTIDLKNYQTKRLSLIDALERGEIDKIDFIIANLNLYESDTLLKPQSIESLASGIYYYQYYNTNAKYHQIKYRELKYKDPFVAVEHRKKSDALYKTKEWVTYQLLNSLTDEPVIAYYVKSNSKKLKKKLVEIILPNQQKVILHSLDNKVINLLKRKSLLKKGLKKSQIDNYINQPYYKV